MIKWKNVTFAYDKRPAIKKASFEIKEGEYIGLIGPNGGGKTTALKLILGFLKPTSGTSKVSVPYTHISYLPQNPAYDKAFPISVLEVVLSGLTGTLSLLGCWRKNAKQEAIDALKLVGMSGFVHDHFGSLSGGQAQRVLLARALVSKPQILILDEPTANVDPGAEEAILSLLEKLKGSMTILIVSHDFEAVVNSVDRLLCFQTEVMTLKPKDVCEHFTIGLYHG